MSSPSRYAVPSATLKSTRSRPDAQTNGAAANRRRTSLTLTGLTGHWLGRAATDARRTIKDLGRGPSGRRWAVWRGTGWAGLPLTLDGRWRAHWRRTWRPRDFETTATTTGQQSWLAVHTTRCRTCRAVTSADRAAAGTTSGTGARLVAAHHPVTHRLRCSDVRRCTARWPGTIDCTLPQDAEAGVEHLHGEVGTLSWWLCSESLLSSTRRTPRLAVRRRSTTHAAATPTLGRRHHSARLPADSDDIQHHQLHWRMHRSRAKRRTLSPATTQLSFSVLQPQPLQPGWFLLLRSPSLALYAYCITTRECRDKAFCQSIQCVPKIFTPPPDVSDVFWNLFFKDLQFVSGFYTHILSLNLLRQTTKFHSVIPTSDSYAILSASPREFLHFTQSLRMNGHHIHQTSIQLTIMSGVQCCRHFTNLIQSQRPSRS